ncbi:LLM class flavin-dependent oxidoreductase [Roseomonas sp. 18066]|uniref:LLM class flavin-dependent oxidoreductase n=1 Tax=Roseomonas sp. 18066 TaxID=2681412 RepID=UPI00135832D3|nr:LLM class flavin-dependent oxidoreductase [Roseomonas sp. 18066]
MPAATLPPRRLRLGVFAPMAGHHIGGWRLPGAHPGGEDFSVMLRIAQQAEAACFDLFFLGDSLSVGPSSTPSVAARFEPLTLLSALAAVTRHIGLAGTATTSYGDPYTLARQFASLDHISGGRAAWNIVTSSNATAPYNYGRDGRADHQARYDRAAEFVEVARGLWDSWEDGALLRDQASGRFLDADRLHALNHDGPHFSVRGPLNLSRMPQGHPVLIQAGSSKAGQDLAATVGEVIFTAQESLDAAQDFYRGLKARIAAAGRDPDAIAIMPGVQPIIGATPEAAAALYRDLQEAVSLPLALQGLSLELGHDVTGWPLDAPLPPLPPTEGIKSRAELLAGIAAREGLTLRQLALRAAGARGHCILVGTADQVADRMAEWFDSGAADGFNIMPPYLPGGFDAVAAELVPRLQARGLAQTAYAGRTLRENLGLAAPANRHAARRKQATGN